MIKDTKNRLGHRRRRMPITVAFVLVVGGMTTGFAGIASAAGPLAGSVVALPTVVHSDGTATSTITVSFSGGASGSTDNIQLTSQGSNAASINGGAPGAAVSVPASGNVATFAVSDAVAQDVTFTATDQSDVTDGKPAITGSATVSYGYQVTFDANGGTGTQTSEVSNVAAPLSLRSSGTIARTGFAFNGWNTQANGLGTSYADGASFPFSADTTLYAKWTALPNQTVTFDANGGTGSLTSESANVPTALTSFSSGSISRQGYTFTGWNTLANGSGTAYADGATYPFAASTTLFAQWSLNATFTVTFDANGGTGTLASESKNFATNLTSFSNGSMVNAGLSFAGWNTAKDGTGTSYVDGAVYPFTLSTTLYAQWSYISEAKTFPVNAEATGLNSIGFNPQKVGDLVILTTQVHSQSIQVTNVSAPGTGTWHLAKRYVDSTNKVITEEIWWSVATSTGPTTATVTYSASVAAISPELVVDSFTTASSPAAWSFVAGAGNAQGGATTLNLPSVTSDAGANQLYWGYAESTQTSATNNSANFYYDSTAAGNLTLFDVALKANTAYAPTALNIPAANDTSIAGIFEANPTHTVTFDPNGGTGSLANESNDVAAPLSTFSTGTITRAGYYFTGWNTKTDGSGTPYADGATYAFTANATLYAQWTSVPTFTVTFNANGGTGSQTSETSSSATALTPVSSGTIARAGYTFTGWNTSAAGTGTAYANGATYPFTSSVTLYAQWKAIPAPKLHASRLIGSITAGKTSTVTIVGTGFLGASKVTSNAAGTKVRIVHVTSTRIVVHVTVKKGTHRGTHTLKIALRNGKSCTIKYLSR